MTPVLLASFRFHSLTKPKSHLYSNIFSFSIDGREISSVRHDKCMFLPRQMTSTSHGWFISLATKNCIPWWIGELNVDILSFWHCNQRWTILRWTLKKLLWVHNFQHWFTIFPAYYRFRIASDLNRYNSLAAWCLEEEAGKARSICMKRRIVMASYGHRTLFRAVKMDSSISTFEDQERIFSHFSQLCKTIYHNKNSSIYDISISWEFSIENCYP